jgi:flagellar basal body-associated protein FliL
MANSEPDFLSLPKAHHHVSRLVILVIILVVIAIIGWLYVYLFSTNSPLPGSTVTAPTNNQVTDADRIKLLSQSSNSQLTNPNMTDAQRAALLGKKSKTTVNTSMTDAERISIMSQPAASQ